MSKTSRELTRYIITIENRTETDYSLYDRQIVTSRATSYALMKRYAKRYPNAHSIEVHPIRDESE
jgi:hypothetical protein